MSQKIFVNLPVSDLPKSRDFFKSLGWRINEECSDDTAACVIISDHIYTILLTHPKFCEFTRKPICNAMEATEVLVCLSCESREEVDEIVARAVDAGGEIYASPKDHGFMYQHSFQDLDGHQWELVHMPSSSSQNA